MNLVVVGGERDEGATVEVGHRDTLRLAVDLDDEVVGGAVAAHLRDLAGVDGVRVGCLDAARLVVDEAEAEAGELDDGLVVAGAYAISEYLGELVRRAPPDDRARDPFPGSDEDRAEVRRLVDWFHGKLAHEVSREMLREKIEGRLRPELSRQQPDAQLLRALRSNLRYHLSYISYLADQRRWLAGDELSFADMAAAGHLSCLDYLDEVPWQEYPTAQAWYVRLKSRPSFRPLLVDRISGIVPPLHYDNLDF